MPPEPKPLPNFTCFGIEGGCAQGHCKLQAGQRHSAAALLNDGSWREKESECDTLQFAWLMMV
jgi:hypothetical protein